MKGSLRERRESLYNSLKFTSNLKNFNKLEILFLFINTIIKIKTHNIFEEKTGNYISYKLL